METNGFYNSNSNDDFGKINSSINGEFKNDDNDDDELKSPFDFPSNKNIFYKIFYFICFPLNFLIYYTVPNLKINFWKKFFLLTFLMSLIWITMFSYIMVWMITIIGM